MGGALLAKIVLTRKTAAVLGAVIFLAPWAQAADIVPDALGDFVRQSAGAFEPEDTELFAEFGFEEGQRASYTTADGRALTVTGYRFQDATGAFAAYQWMRPADGEPAPYGEQALRRGELIAIRFGSYVVEMRGAEAIDTHVEAMLAFLPRVTLRAPPPVRQFVPEQDLIPFSGRYIIGPVALAAVAPEIPPSVAAFRLDGEGQFVRYQTDAGELRMILFSYPSAQIARGQIDSFHQLSKVAAKRDGPLIAVVIDPPSADEAERLLARVRYAGEVTVTPREPRRHDNFGIFLQDVVWFCLLLIVLMIVGGTAVAGARMLGRRAAGKSIIGEDGDTGMIRLDINFRE